MDHDWLRKIYREGSVPPTANVQELHAELEQIGLEGFFAITVDLESFDIFPDMPALIVIPSALFVQLISDHRDGIDRETLVLAMRETVTRLREYEPTCLLAETLLSLSSLEARYEPAGKRLQMVVEALSLLRALGADHRLARALVRLGEVLHDLGHHHDALLAFERGAEKASGDAIGGALIASLHGEATSYNEMGLYVEALQALAHAQKLLPKTSAGDKWLEQILQQNIRSNIGLRRYESALESAERWRGITDSYVSRYYRADILAALGRASEALADYLEAAASASSEIRGTRSMQFRRGDRRHLNRIFDRALHEALRQGAAGEVLGALELSLGGAASGQRAIDRNDVFHSRAHTALTKEALDVAREAHAAVMSGKKSALTGLHDRAEWLIAQHDALVRQWTSSDLSVEDLRSWESKLRTSLPPDCVLLAYFNAGREIHALTVTQATVKAYSLGLTLDQLRRLSEGFARECMGLFPTCALDVLASKLLYPVAGALEGMRRIVIVRTAELESIPFHAMRVEGRRLVESYSISYSRRPGEMIGASGDSFPRLRQDSTWVGLGAASVNYLKIAELPGVDLELAAARALFNGSTSLLNLSATSKDLLNLEGGPDVLHLACHTVFSSEHPLLSYFLLADRPVFCFEVMLTNINVKHVVLSGCGTARSSGNVAGHTQSLAHAFIAGGARTVLASLWPVDDEAASECMRRVYDELITGERSMSDALRLAQLGIIAGSEDGDLHPYYWAPFAVNGAK